MSEALLDRETVGRALHAAGAGPIVVAFSGGGDSTALLHLLRDECGAARLLAVVVDHALRDGSAEEAAHACAGAETLGVAARRVRLDWPSGVVSAQATAREARYAALCAEARSAGARVIAAGHTRDDQAETVYLRARAQSGWRGLAGMRAFGAAPLWPEGRGLLLVRPLLGARRADLRGLLQARGAAWIEDPSNDNRSYARVRARARLARLETDGLDPMRLARVAEQLRPLAHRLDAEAAALIEAAARFEGGRIVIARARWSGPREVRRRALSALIAAAAGAAREARFEAVGRLEAAMAEAAFRGATLGGARLAPAGADWRLTRDGGALRGRADGARAPAPLPLPAGEEAVWDGRLSLAAIEPGWSAWPGRTPDAPAIGRGAERLSLSEAEGAGLVRPVWLVAEHAARLLGAGVSPASGFGLDGRGDRAAFTPL